MKSVWIDRSKLPSFDRLRQDIKTDVLIIGGGMAGILCAYLLAQDGIDYALLEADTICSGVTKNTTAKVTSQHGLIYDKLLRTIGLEGAQGYLEANQSALMEFRKLCQDIDCGFEEKDAYVYALNNREKIDKELKALDKIGFPAEFAQQLPLPFPVAGAVRFPKQAQFQPLAFVSAITQGLNIYEHTPVRELSPCLAKTEDGSVTAKKIIVATHFPTLNKHGSYFMKLYQDRSYVIGLEGAADVKGMYLDESDRGLSFRNYGSLLLLGGGSHRTGKQGGNWRELEDAAKNYYPGAKIAYRWAAQDCMTLDGAPYIGQYSKQTPDFYVATGFNKWGMTSSMVAAMVMRELVNGREHPYEAAFSPSRTMLRPQLAVNVFEAGVSLLTISKKRCPHLGCALKWNPQEHSWDCPCHGSRFTEHGKLIDNPATGNLPCWEEARHKEGRAEH